MKKEWFLFQEEIKDYFKNLGCDAATNVTIKGVRTEHDIDVLVKSKFLGHDITWVIEAKKWKSKVSKLHVLALRQIIDDIGVDKGFIVSEKGFQKGAISAAKKSNVELLTFEELKLTTDNIFHREILRGYLKRINLNICRYYSHDKDTRIKYGLRQDTIGFEFKFNAHVLLIAVSKALHLGLKNIYPICLDSYLEEQFGEKKADNFYQLVNWLNLNLSTIEEKILEAEIEMQKNNEFEPKLWLENSDENMHMKVLDKMAEFHIKNSK